MSSQMYRSSRPDSWNQPRPYTDASLRFQKNGRVLPMEEDRPGFFARMLGAR